MKEEDMRAYLEGIITTHLLAIAEALRAPAILGGDSVQRNWEEAG
jgi:hypothetical protein